MRSRVGCINRRQRDRDFIARGAMSCIFFFFIYNCMKSTDVHVILRLLSLSLVLLSFFFLGIFTCRETSISVSYAEISRKTIKKKINNCAYLHANVNPHSANFTEDLLREIHVGSTGTPSLSIYIRSS